MGNKRRARFLSEHPICCYCSGRSHAETEDHNPARKLMPPGSWPRGFVFPACVACNAGKRIDESLAAEVLHAFNVNEPVNDQHAESMTKRTRSYLERDPDFRQVLFDGIDAAPSGSDRVPFVLPHRFQMAMHRTGMRLFQALFYRVRAHPVPNDKHIVIRLVSNHGIEEEGEILEAFTKPLIKFEPEPVAKTAPHRFGWGYAETSAGLALAAEVAGSVVWFGFVLDQEPPDDWKDRFAWYGGDGRFLGIGEERAVPEAA